MEGREDRSGTSQGPDGLLDKTQKWSRCPPRASHRLEFLVLKRRVTVGKLGVWWIHFWWIVVCIQCMILKININNNKHRLVDLPVFFTNIVWPTFKTVIFHLIEDCCVCKNSVISFWFFFFFCLQNRWETKKSWYLIALFNKCYIDVKDCINCRDSFGKTLYRCNLLHNTIV